MPSFLSGRQFVATFKVEKCGINKNVAHLLLDKNKEVIDISASGIQMLGIDVNKIFKKKAKFDISILLPTLFGANCYQYVNKTGYQIEYFYPEIVEIDKNEDKQSKADVDAQLDSGRKEDEDDDPSTNNNSQNQFKNKRRRSISKD